LSSRVTTIGVISDTHGLLRPDALKALRGSDLILHAGDIGSEEIVPKLAEIAPVIAVRGNIDTEPWTRELPETIVVEVGAMKILLTHNRAELKVVPSQERCSVVVFGHSHKPHSETVGGVLWFNPGSAGPRRFKLPISVGRLQWDGNSLRDEHILL
jgi:putative phosphoesterase